MGVGQPFIQGWWAQPTQQGSWHEKIGAYVSDRCQMDLSEVVLSAQLPTAGACDGGYRRSLGKWSERWA